MKILVVTTEWPRCEGDTSGIHVIHQIRGLEQVGLRVDVFSFQGRKNPMNYWRASRQFNRLDLTHYDVIHAHHGQSGLVAISQRQCPVVVTFHGSDLQGIRDMRGRVTLLGYVLRLTSRWTASQADAVILVSDSLARHLSPKINYRIIPAGIDTQLFCPQPVENARQALGLPLSVRLVLFIGDPARTEKRYWLAQETVSLLPASSNAQLVTAHNIPHEKMPIYMNACDVLLITSSTEGSPTTVKESLACNLPVVSTDVGDVRERIGNIEGCEVCADDRPETIAAALARVLSLGQRINGRQAVLELDEKLLTQKVIQVYYRAIQGKKQA